MNGKKRGGAIETGEVTKTQWWEYRYWVGRKKTAKAIVDQRLVLLQIPYPFKKLGNSGSLFNWIQRQKCQKKFRGVFRTKLSIYHEVFCENS